MSQSDLGLAPQFFTIPANGEKKRQLEGDYIVVFEHSGEFEINIDSRGWLPVTRRCGLPFVYRESVEIRSTTAQRIVLLTGYTNGLNPYDTLANSLTVGDIERINQAVKVVNDPDSVLDVLLSAPSILRELPDVEIPANTRAKLADDNTNRVELHVSMPDDATAPARVGSASVTATSGARLGAGAVAIYNVSGEVWAFNTSADPVTVAIAEVVK